MNGEHDDTQVGNFDAEPDGDPNELSLKGKKKKKKVKKEKKPKASTSSNEVSALDENAL